jgi:4-hydroxymandelate oxidase
MRNLETLGRADASRWGSDSSFAQYVHQLIDPSLTWDDVAWLRSITKLPVVLKGILTAEDGQRAVDAGAAAIVVSNHGGRQLDGAVATIDALPEGIRRGTDVLIALALGARGVLIGRPYLWGLAASGEQGVRQVLEILRAELELALALAGCPDVDHVDSSLIAARR